MIPLGLLDLVRPEIPFSLGNREDACRIVRNLAQAFVLNPGFVIDELLLNFC